MKFIKKFKSLNYNDRKISSINHIIIHYTNLPNHTEAIKYLCSSEKKVSSHFLISKKGDIYNLVPEVHRAWHAGLSKWEDKTDINSSSIGIELDYFPNDFNKKYSNKLIQSLIELLKYLINKYKIDKKNILGHSDIASIDLKCSNKSLILVEPTPGISESCDLFIFLDLLFL